MNKPEKKQWLLKIGYVVKAHSLDGRLRACLLRDTYSLKCGQQIYLERPARLPQEDKSNQNNNIHGPFELERVQKHNMFWLLKLKGLDGISEAERFKGFSIGVHSEKINKDLFWIDDIIECEVYTVSGRNLGRIKDVLKTGANDVYVVVDGAGKENLIPAIKKIVKDIDTRNKKIIIEPIPGLLSDKSED